MDANFAGKWNQEEGNDTDLVLSIDGYVINYANRKIIQTIGIQSEIALSIMETGYIDLSQAMRGVLPFVSIIKETEFVLKLQGDSPNLLWSDFENPLAVHEDNQRATATTVTKQMWLRTKHTVIPSVFLSRTVT